MCYPLSSLLVVRAVKLMFSVDMMLLSITFIYTGRVCGWLCVCVCVCVCGWLCGGGSYIFSVQGMSSTSGVECTVQQWVGLECSTGPTLD